MKSFNYQMDHILSVSEIQDYFEYILKKHVTVTNNPSIMISVNKIECRILFKLKTGHYFKPLTPETINYLEALKVR